jgi:hypothetical protein
VCLVIAAVSRSCLQMFAKILTPTCRQNVFSLTSFRYLHPRRNNGARLPFAQNYRNRWPETENVLPDHVPEPSLPPRTISDDCLTFKLTSTFDRGSSIFYSHLHTHPADLKVTLTVTNLFLMCLPSQ